MPINERGEFVRDRPRPSSAATGSEGGNSGGENRSSRGWGGRAVLSMLVLLGASAIWNYMSGSGKSPPPSTTARSGEQNVPTASAPSAAVTPDGQNVRFSNTCSQPVRVYVSYTTPLGLEVPQYYDLSPGVSTYLATAVPGERVRAIRQFFYFAQITAPEREYRWHGEVDKFVNGNSYKMRSVDIGNEEAHIAISCPNFWRIVVKNSCEEEVSLAVSYYSPVPGKGFRVGAWWTLPPGVQKTLPIEEGGFVEVSSSSASTPGEIYYFAKSLSHNWGKRENDEGKMVLVEDKYYDMRLAKLTPDYQGPHLDFTCTSSF